MHVDPTSPPESPTASEDFFGAAVPRMTRFILLFGSAFTGIACWRYGLISGMGFACGALLSYIGFRSLYKAVRSLASRIVDAHHHESGYSIVAGFFVRYLLAGVAGYVIFTSSPQAFRGFLFGLCTPVAAMLTEAGFEGYSALRRS